MALVPGWKNGMTTGHDKAQQKIIDYGDIFGTVAGKRVLDDLSRECQEHNSTYTRADTHHTAFLEGKRNVILYIRTKLASNPYDERQKKAKV